MSAGEAAEKYFFRLLKACRDYAPLPTERSICVTRLKTHAHTP